MWYGIVVFPPSNLPLHCSTFLLLSPSTLSVRLAIYQMLVARSAVLPLIFFCAVLSPLLFGRLLQVDVEGKRTGTETHIGGYDLIWYSLARVPTRIGHVSANIR